MPPKASMWAKARAVGNIKAVKTGAANAKPASLAAGKPASLAAGKPPSHNKPAATPLDPLDEAVAAVLALTPMGHTPDGFDNEFAVAMRQFHEARHALALQLEDAHNARLAKIKSRADKKEGEAKAVARPVLALRKTQSKLLSSKNYSEAWEQMKEIRKAEKDAVAAHRAAARPEMEAELAAANAEREREDAQLRARVATAEERIRAHRAECSAQLHNLGFLPTAAAAAAEPPPPPVSSLPPFPQPTVSISAESVFDHSPPAPPPHSQHFSSHSPPAPPPHSQHFSSDSPYSQHPPPHFSSPATGVSYVPPQPLHPPQPPLHHTQIGSAVASMMMHSPPALLARPLDAAAAIAVPYAAAATAPSPYTGVLAGQVPLRPLPPAWQPGVTAQHSGAIPVASPWVTGGSQPMHAAAEALMSAASMLLNGAAPPPMPVRQPISPAPTPAPRHTPVSALKPKTTSAPPQQAPPPPQPQPPDAARAQPQIGSDDGESSDFDEITTPKATTTHARDDVPNIALGSLPKPNVSAADRKREAAKKASDAQAGWSRAGTAVRRAAMPAINALNAAARDGRHRHELESDSDRSAPATDGPTEKQRNAAKLLMGAAARGGGPSAAPAGGGRLAAALSRARAQKPESSPAPPPSEQAPAAPPSSSKPGIAAVMTAQKAAQKMREQAAKKRMFTTEDFKQLFSNCRHGRRDAVVRLLENGCPVDGRDSFGNTPLIIACQNGQARIVKACLRHGANVDAQNKQGNSALHYCVAYGFSALGDYLISKGASDQVKNHAGLTPYEGIAK